MPRQNVVFAILAPVVLMAIIAAIVIGIGELLLAMHHMGAEAFHVAAAHSEEEKHELEELAALYPVVGALVIATLFLIGGAVASRMAPQRSQH